MSLESTKRQIRNKRKLERERERENRQKSKEAQWIPVSERLPEEKQEFVLVVEKSDDDIIVNMGWLGHYGWHNFEDRLIDVTYWQPLPAPPKEEG